MRTRWLGILLALAALVVAAPAAAADDWLGEINRYREAAGVPAVADDPALDLAMQRHIIYLENDLQDGESPHTEVLGRPGYSPAGALEAENSNIAIGSPGVFSSPIAAIDSWWESPFHAIGMLRPGLAGTHLALAGDGSVAMLDVFSDLTTFAPAAAPVLFPGPGSVTDLTTYSGAEVPSPLSACGLPTNRAYGLPLIALLPTAPAAGLSATLAGPAGTQSLCVVDADTFRSDATGQTILQQDDAVVLIPGAPLATGAYTATIAEPGQPNLSWSFTESGTPAATTPGPSPAPGAPSSGSPGSPGRSRPSPGKTKPSAGTTKRSPGKTKRSPGKTKPSAGKARPSPGDTKPSPGKTSSSPETSPVLTVAAAGGHGLTLRGRGAATVTVSAAHLGHRVAQRTFHERAGRWHVALALPHRLHGKRVTVTVRITEHGHTTVRRRRLRF
jgi:hypothetical protein